jgi:hypothetical protein
VPHDLPHAGELAAQEEAENPVPPAGEAGSAEECEVCGARMFGLHCKLVCPRCGFRRDCSDP